MEIVKQQTTFLETHMRALLDGLKSSEERFKKMSEQLNGMDERINDRFSTLEKRLTEVEQRSPRSRSRTTTPPMSPNRPLARYSQQQSTQAEAETQTQIQLQSQSQTQVQTQTQTQNETITIQSPSPRVASPFVPQPASSSMSYSYSAEFPASQYRPPSPTPPVTLPPSTAHQPEPTPPPARPHDALSLTEELIVFWDQMQVAYQAALDGRLRPPTMPVGPMLERIKHTTQMLRSNRFGLRLALEDEQTPWLRWAYVEEGVRDVLTMENKPREEKERIVAKLKRRLHCNGPQPAVPVPTRNSMLDYAGTITTGASGSRTLRTTMERLGGGVVSNKRPRQMMASR